MAKPAAPDPRIRRQHLPGLLGLIERVAGYEVAERVAVRFGGQELYLPGDCDGRHPLARAVGLRPARAICRSLGGARGPKSGGAWDVPVGDVEIKHNAVRRLRLEGLSRNEIVTRLREEYRLPISVARVSELTRDLAAHLPARPARAQEPATAEAAPSPDDLPLFAPRPPTEGPPTEG